MNIGSGSYGKVVRSKEDPSKVIKIVNKRFMKKQNLDPYNEVQIYKRINNSIDTIVHFHSFYEDPINIYIILDYLPGGELFDYIERHHPLDKKTIKRFANILAKTLSQLHALGIVYCDLKLENICLDENESIYLVDFGDAKYDPTPFFRYTIPFAAPEVLLLEKQDHLSDWWSFGIVIYALLTNRYPWKCDEDREEVIRAAIYYPTFLDDESVDFLKMLLCKNRMKRLVNIDAIHDHAFMAQ